MSLDILRLFKDRNAVVSGEKISAELGISRAAVWKKIEALRKKGFVIKAVPSKGYQLLHYPDLSPEGILLRLDSGLFKEVLFYQSLDSTNKRALSLASKEGIGSGTVIIADSQDKGKGRLGRSWFSPSGANIYMSIVLQPEIAPRDATLITVIAALACAAALRTATGLEFRIKWPNDIVYSGKKTGGILTEIRSDPDKILMAVIGIGINVNTGGDQFPEELRPIATSVRSETGRHHSRNEIIIGILREFEGRYLLFKDKGRGPLIKELRTLSSTIGQKVRVIVGNEVITGIAEDIDDEGVLLLRTASGEPRRISSGDLTMLR